jgi:hypothetical protein
LQINFGRTATFCASPMGVVMRVVATLLAMAISLTRAIHQDWQAEQKVERALRKKCENWSSNPVTRPRTHSPHRAVRGCSENSTMNFQKFLIPVAVSALLVAAYFFNGWPGLVVVVSMLVMWVLLYFTRMMQVLKRTTGRPIGYVDSAVMFNAKLKPKASLLHVLAMTRALGELRSVKDVQPEIFRWTDSSASYVDCTFINGKLTNYSLTRPVADRADSEDSGSSQKIAPPAP